MRPVRLAATLGLIALLPACAGGGSLGDEHASGVQRGLASWYGALHHGRRTASGEIFDQNALTAAHRRLPFGTLLHVTNERTGRSVVVRVNDRGPFNNERILDLSRAAAEQIGLIDVAPVVFARL
jgi:rare lipoprotein A